jgi:hypothetical protein
MKKNKTRRTVAHALRPADSLLMMKVRRAASRLISFWSALLCALIGGAVAASEPETAPADARAQHWSFQPLVRPAIPAAAGPVAGELSSPPANAIDRFIGAALEAEGLRLSPVADRRTLIRRVYFDVIGLPPTPDEIERFADDADPAAYERLVERLLASPHMGERWARHWLDVVRFAESHGFEMNQPRPNAWPYRDYVIRAFNDDLPYDRFILEQLAGDSLGADAATGFLVGGPWDQVKSPDPVLTAQQRADELHDMVATTGSAFLGLTVGCARCHAHKFDPISQVDYYAMTAALAGVGHGERRTRPPDWQERQQQAERYRRQLAAVSAKLARLEPLAQLPPAPAADARHPVRPEQNTDRFAPVIASRLRFMILATDLAAGSGAEPCLDELEVFTTGDEPRNAALASEGTQVTVSSTLPGHAIHQPQHINDGQYGNARSWISNEPGRGAIELAFAQPVEIERVVWSRDRSQPPQFRDRLATRYEIAISSDGQSWQTVASSWDRGTGPATALAAGSTAEAAERRRLEDDWRELTARIESLTVDRPLYAGVFAMPATTHRLQRGDPMQPREPVMPGGLARFGGQLPGLADAPEPDRRLALARWIASPENPLTARAIVNRLWQHHFGTGIVSTPSDLGLNGARPSHPELLDWLASELVEPAAGGPRWSLKHIHRLILLSATYRQASAASPAGIERDAQARLLWRFPPRRLEAEAIRDAMLAISGRLDRSLGGPGFDLFEPNTNYVKVYTPTREFGPDTFRRMVYQSKPRMQLDDTFGAFDCPDAGQIAPRRSSSTTPLQALNLLNSPFVIQQAGFLAARLSQEAADDLPRQVARAFMLTFGREPSADELSAAIRLATAYGLPAFCRALFNANEFLMIY